MGLTKDLWEENNGEKLKTDLFIDFLVVINEDPV